MAGKNIGFGGSMSAVIQRAIRDTIGDAMARAAERFRDKVAVRFASRSWTFGELDKAASRIACGLRAAGLGHGDRIVAFGRNSDFFLLAWLGCCKAGIIHVPANYALSAPELGYIVKQSGAKLVLYDEALAETALACGAAAEKFEWIMGLEGPHVGDDVSDTDIAQILYTSGTTGTPKGAMLTHRALLSEYASSIIGCEFTGADKWLGALPLYHSAPLHVFAMPPLLVGAEIILVDIPAPAHCLEVIERESINAMFCAPTLWITLLRHADFSTRDLRSLKKAYYGAAIMPVPILHELRARLPGLLAFNCYGQSEISPLATILKPHEHDARPASVGRPVLNVQTRVVDVDMNDMPAGEAGEIVHRSPHLMLGYWDKPKETEQAFAGGWFHSGDVGYFDAEGYLYIVDRIKDVINTGGVQVASREVEDALFTHPALAEVAVIAIPDAKWIEAVAAVVVLREGAAVSEAELIDHVRPTLAGYKLPKRIFFAESLPKNTAGKLLKRELRTRYSGTATAVMGIETSA